MLTFAFTDIEGSTQLWERAPDDMKGALARHDELLRDAITAHGGRVFATGGDGVAAVFDRADAAVGAAVDAQARLAAEPWPDAVAIRVRMGLHSGHADERDGDYFGPTLNRGARLMAVAHGGQIVCSAVTVGLLDGASTAPLVDLGQHRLRDLSAPVGVFQVGPGSFPPLRSLDSVPSNLPTMLTELVGRHDDVASLVAAVRSNRLVTLTGVGGVGKTRLALAVGGAVAPDFPDGCWLVELAPVADGTDVVRAVATALGASSVTVGDPSALLRYLEHRRLLLVLDNCEHLVDAAADLVDGIVAAAPDVHLITTSREPLGVDGEIVRRVRSLDGAPALNLFVERARAVDDAFVATDANADAIAAICAHLDGIPLAIELAAARVVAMSPAEIARRLDDRFRVLTGGRRAQERHRTLQATVGWSYDLLAKDDRRVFTRLSVFPATFDLSAALAVCDTDDVDAIVRLVQRSLVVHDHTTGRYRLLETLRQYGSDRLVEIDESDATRQRYADYFVGLVARHGRGVEDSRHDDVVPLLLAEMENLRATADWLISEARMSEARMAQLRRLLLDAGMFFPQFAPAELVGWLDAALADGDVDPRDRVGLLGIAAVNAADIHRFEACDRYTEESAQLAATSGVADSTWAQSGRFHAATLHRVEPETALRAADAMLELAEREGNAYAAAHAVAQSTTALFVLGRHDEVDARIEEALRRAEALDNASAVGVALLCTSSVLIARGTPADLERARTLLLRHDDHIGRSFGGIIVSWLLAWRAIASADDPARAVIDALDAARFADRAGAPLALVCAVDALITPCAQLGLADECRRLAAYLAEHGELLEVTLTNEYMKGVRACALASLVPTDARPPALPRAPANRRELFDLLARIEQAVA